MKDAGRLGRILGRSGDILDRMEVFNSVEVRAPEIDLREDFVNFDASYGKWWLGRSFVNILQVYFVLLVYIAEYVYIMENIVLHVSFIFICVAPPSYSYLV